MPVNILMPALSPTMEKGNLAKWLKKEGDTVKAGDVIAEIETDKATMEVEAVDEGRIAKILIAEGTADVAVNTPIAILAGEGEDLAAAAAGGGAKPAPAAQPAPAAPSAATPAPVAAAAPTPAAPVAASAPAIAPAAATGANRVFSSPLARRIARDGGIDIALVAGTGPRGRVIQRDVEAAIAAGTGKAGSAPAASAAAPAPVAAAAAAPAPAPKPAAAPSGLSDEAILKLFEPGSYELVPHDGMRRTIARRLAESTQTIPHFYLTVDCDIDALLALREQINASAPVKDGKPAFKVSVNDFVIKALAVALQRVPTANVSWTEAGMLRHKDSDVGVAVAMPGGLITPIIRKAQMKTISAISNETKDFAARARSRKLLPNEYQGGTTAVSNLGMFGMKHFTAVINPPHATILAVGAGEARAVVRGGEVKVVQQMTVTLSCDHRAIDGALGAELLSAFKDLVEKPMSMLV
ncbi:pyruvate dehydrogenase complex dihydrolipoamide acetyltransferase [Prosthecodimorpha staleyi]|uniref:Acetyltransferase component of pyruvate dehydrogenase complex n=1 Tax=Prosthecodimorpha staleyi TaxID=2840188 RepID=A0A947GE36_9HYPH|nr:pyruvate dehydrogenase complex dihydrolipoamide acetyltransferase [Prosthecodimorpha staleyi]MBT9291467.1 pyruvate dehydrogenase complex dihydrolipoamide acetyltransferase [Prosthecodimorpha staleyi]